jgi:hypothetical protein
MNFLVRKYWPVLMLLLLGAMLASAQTTPPRRIALLQYINGSVSIQPHGTGSWVAAELNNTLNISDNVWTDKASQAEVNVGTGMLRMNSETSLSIVNIGFHTVQVKIHQGTVHLHVRHLFDGELYEVDSDNARFTLTKSGDYRFDVDPKTDTTTIAVWKGAGTITGEHPAVRIHGRQQVVLTGATAYERHNVPAPDGFDEWCRVRNQRQDNAYPVTYPYPYAYPYPYPYPPGVILYGRPRWWWY